MKTPARPLGRTGLALVLALSVLLLPTAARAQELTENGWTTSASTPARAVVGSPVTIRTNVMSDQRTDALVDVEIYGPSGQKVAQRYWDNEPFTRGQLRTFDWTWTVPSTAPAGTYYIVVGIFNPGWGTNWHWNDTAASIPVDQAVTNVPTTTLPTTTTAPPTTTVTVPPPTTAPPTTTISVPPPPTTAPPTTTTAAPTTTAPSAPTTTVMDHGAHQHVACPGERDETPMGALPPALPVLCDLLAPAVDTARRGTNSWVDDFNHGSLMSELPSSYVQGHVGRGGTSRHFLHNNHWMVDIRSDSGQYPTLVAAWMRPNATFRPRADGSVVIEFEVATPIAGTRDNAAISDSWPEFAISPAPAPSGEQEWGSPFLRNGTYFYEAFADADVMGCRIQQSRHPICAFYGAGSDGAGAPDRQWEINQNGTDVVPGTEYGGDPTSPGLADVWATCSRTDDPDTTCRNVFRVTLTATRIRIDVKKPGGQFVRFYEAVPCNDRAGCATGQMGRIINNPNGFYVFFADFAYRIENDEVIRFHWDRLAVNP